MKKTIIYIFVLLVWCNIGYSKSLFYNKYKNDPNNELYIEHIRSVESGMSWMQIHADIEVYCPPSKFKMNKDTLINSMEIGVDHLKKDLNFSNQELDGFPVELIMLSGLKILFPCS